MFFVLPLRTQVTNMVFASERGQEQVALSMLWLVSYLFLLRVPSEVGSSRIGECIRVWVCGVDPCQALPMKRCAPGSIAAQNAQSIIWREGDEVCVRLARRKNRPRGSGTMRRQCSCAGGVRTCAVHTLWERFFAHLPDGTCPWTAVSPNHARARLRQLLQTLGVPDAGAYGTHDLRRGHAEAGLKMCTCAACFCAVACSFAQDMRACGHALAEILAAGQWKSAAFIKYVKEAELEKEVAYQVAIESEEEEWID